MERPLDLLAQKLLDAGVVVAEGIDADAGEQVEITLIGAIDEVCPAAALHQDVVAGVCSKDVFAFEFFDVRELHRLESLAYARKRLRPQ